MKDHQAVDNERSRQPRSGAVVAPDTPLVNRKGVLAVVQAVFASTAIVTLLVAIALITLKTGLETFL